MESIGHFAHTYPFFFLGGGLDDKELKRVLQSLSCGKHKLLIKNPASDTVTDNDTFTYNNDFTASAVRLKINSLQQEQSVEERKETQTKVLVDRQYQVSECKTRSRQGGWANKGMCFCHFSWKRRLYES